MYTGGEETEFSLSDSGSDSGSESSPPNLRDIYINNREKTHYKPGSCSNMCTPSRKVSHEKRGVRVSAHNNFYKKHGKENCWETAVPSGTKNSATTPLTEVQNKGVENSRKNPASATESLMSTSNSKTPPSINIASILSEITDTLKKIASRLDQQESRLASMEAKLEASASSSASPRSATKPKIPLAVRVGVVKKMFLYLCNYVVLV